MSDLKIDVVIDNVSKVVGNAHTEAQKAVVKAVNDTVDRAQLEAPVDTGYLKNSIQADLENISDLEGAVGVGAEYGIYVEFGTRNTPAQPFLIPTAEAVGEEFVKVMKAIFKETRDE